MPTTQNKKLVLAMTDAFNTGDASIVDEMLDPEPYPNHGAPGVPRTSGELKKKIAAVRRAFPDLHYEVDRIVAEDESVAFHWIMTGTHGGPLLGHPPTNRKITHSGTDVVTFQDGKIVEHYAADNFADLLGKLGIERGGAAPR
ncbi:MAG TPA: ester cyclase [Rugosimonospora sp.]|nr:ester cyclase [Rugosimonospora sp.]